MACNMQADPICASTPKLVGAHLTIPARKSAVREGLQSLFDTILLQSLPAHERGTAEIVLAEALNNIVEHAYSCYEGEIEISLQLRKDELVCKISDTGLPMPDGQLPSGKLPKLGQLDSLPEGGFGWHLIRSLSKDLDYHREDGRNFLTFRLDMRQSGP
jgi:serine/threonine-protein kinase RsbW